MSIAKNQKEVFHRLRNRYTGDYVISSSLSPRRTGEFGDLIQVFEELRPNRKFWVTENAFEKNGVLKDYTVVESL